MCGLPSFSPTSKRAYKYYSVSRVDHCPGGHNAKLKARLRADHVDQQVVAALAETLADQDALIMSPSSDEFLPFDEWQKLTTMAEGSQFRCGGLTWKKMTSRELRRVTQKGTLTSTVKT